MKLLLCVLSALLLAGCAAGAASGDAIPAPAPAATVETAEAAPTPVPAAAAPQGLEPTGAAVLDYDDIRLIDYERAMQPYPETDYYTMCKDGLWGLMRSDGTEVLSCRAPEPLFECDIDEHHWHGYLDGLAWEETDPLEREYNARLKASGDGTLCDAHDGGGYLGFVDLQDNALHIYYGSLGPGELRAPTDADMLLFSGSVNGFVPVRDGELEAEGDGWFNYIGGEQYVYRNRDSKAANEFIYSAADFFFDAPLAPAQRDGKWVYLDTAGNEVTAPCYDGVYRPNRYTDEPRVFARAAPLLNGCTVVSRDWKFGLLDSTGAELVPCVYDGLVWDGGTAWIRQADGWHEYSIPGVTKPDPWRLLLDSLGADITAPDTPPARTDAIFFTTRTNGERLNLRAGPGTGYDIIGKIPDYLRLRIYGTMSNVPGWALVQYDQQYGWVSTEYLQR